MPSTSPALTRLRKLIAQTWGYRTLRPLQEQAMQAALDHRDSLVVLPTGGGKSLCYQAPALLATEEVTVVVSPLIALMKDQVDALAALGVEAVQLNSTISERDYTNAVRDLRRGSVRLLFVSPERLALDGFRKYLASLNVRTFAIDEAHCISHWGHDFRPEYRQLASLREWFPEASVHAYTATATESVRKDIIEQLGLRDPEVMVGSFDRPNLTYRVVPRAGKKGFLPQVLEVLTRHKGEAGIVYCISRKGVDDLTAELRQNGFPCMPYHAGMSGEERAASQEAFRSGKCDLVVATVAFGMGIDRSDIRFVLHTGMPKSVEHYQQEAGRAGRDGLEAECVLLTSAQDRMVWKRIIEKSAEEGGATAEYVSASLRQLQAMAGYCQSVRCRHKLLVEHFGQTLEGEGCQACDVCLGDVEVEPESQVIAMKVLSCVARVKEGFGVKHVVAILRGERSEGVLRRGHDQLSTFGLLKEYPEKQLADWVRQLVSAGLLEQAGDDYPILKLNAASWAVMKKERAVRLQKAGGPAPRSKAETASWEGVDRGLFHELRALRLELASARQVPPYAIFNDDTLRELARLRPTNATRLRAVRGVGEHKLRDLGEKFMAVIRAYCTKHRIAADQGAAADPNRAAFDLFARGAGLDDVAAELKRSRATVVDQLCTFIRQEKPETIRPWVGDAVYRRVTAAAKQAGGADRLGPIISSLGGDVPYEEVKLVATHLKAVGTAAGE
jgi:ATP-dependent DNA helicase RecQ